MRTVTLAVAVSVYVTAQDPEASVHCPFDGVKYPVALFAESVTDPVGVEPVTLPVHVVKDPTCIVLAEHATVSDAVVRPADGFTTFNEKPPVAPVL